MSRTKRQFCIILCLVLFALLLFMSFHGLRHAPIQNWDEARHGISAYEMLQTHEWIVTTYRYSPDYWNLKPPLSEYFIVLGYQLFGFNGLGMRFFSAVFWVTSALICSFFILRYTELGILACVAVLVGFSAASLPLSAHCARSGDADSLMVLLTSCALILLILDSEKNSHYLLGSCLCFSLAFLTKSWHAGIIAIIIILDLLIRGKLFKLGMKKTLACMLCALGPIVIWAILRYAKDGTKFFELMFLVDLINRSTSVLEEHSGGVLYYVSHLMKDYSTLAFFILAALGTGLNIYKKSYRSILRVCLLGFFVPLVLFSLVKTKLPWYIAGIYPPLILLAAMGTVELFRFAINRRFACIIAIIPLLLITFALFQNAQLVIASHPSSMEQDFISMTDRHATYSGSPIYKYLSPLDDTDWMQGEVLMAEWAGDFVAKKGGLKRWQKNGAGLLLTENDCLDSTITGYTVLAKGNEYCIVGHAANEGGLSPTK